MSKLPLDIQVHFFKVYNNEISISDFEKWLYANQELEKLLDNEIYIDLISLNFQTRHVKHEMGKLIDPFLDFGKFEERKLRRLLNSLIERSPEFAKSLIHTYELYCSGYNFFDNLGLSYGLTFSEDFWDFSDWEKLTSKQKEIRINRIYLEVKKEAELILNWLDEGKVVLTGETDDLGHYEYIDNRTGAKRKFRVAETIELEESNDLVLTNCNSINGDRTIRLRFLARIKRIFGR